MSASSALTLALMSSMSRKTLTSKEEHFKAVLVCSPERGAELRTFCGEPLRRVVAQETPDHRGAAIETGFRVDQPVGASVCPRVRESVRWMVSDNYVPDCILVFGV